jgi:hypothetical protein
MNILDPILYRMLFYDFSLVISPRNPHFQMNVDHTNFGLIKTNSCLGGEKKRYVFV